MVFAVPYGEQLSPADYTEERFDRGIQTAKAGLEGVVAEIETILRHYGVQYRVPPVAQENETELRALFSFKTAAARAGIATASYHQDEPNKTTDPGKSRIWDRKERCWSMKMKSRS